MTVDVTTKTTISASERAFIVRVKSVPGPGEHVWGAVDLGITCCAGRESPAPNMRTAAEFMIEYLQHLTDQVRARLTAEGLLK
ncbi:MAG: hypothetical protein ACTHU0_00185 [Kofleriaceae bacterium]